MPKHPTGPRTYDLTPAERRELRVEAQAQGCSISRVIADFIRQGLIREREDRKQDGMRS